MRSLVIIWSAVVLSAIGVVVAFDYLTMPASAVVCIGPCDNQPSSDKYDGDCQPADTAGRCANKPLVLGAQTPAVVAPTLINGFGGK